jgi:hypothetical protein
MYVMRLRSPAYEFRIRSRAFVASDQWSHRAGLRDFDSEA